MHPPRAAVFLDRDGTLNRDDHFVSDPDSIHVLDRVPEALADLREAGFALVGITNQSGIARGYFDPARLARIHERLQELLGVPLDAIFHCPHHPDVDQSPYGRVCSCRKPGSALTTAAAAVLRLDLTRSFTVGDSARDVIAGHRAGTRTVLVRSGKPWREQLERCVDAGIEPDHVADDLDAATRWILSR